MCIRDRSKLNVLGVESKLEQIVANLLDNAVSFSPPNGKISVICNIKKNVFGMMPHPERSCEKSLGSEDGNLIFKSIMNNII